MSDLWRQCNRKNWPSSKLWRIRGGYRRLIAVSNRVTRHALGCFLSAGRWSAYDLLDQASSQESTVSRRRQPPQWRRGHAGPFSRTPSVYRRGQPRVWLYAREEV